MIMIMIIMIMLKIMIYRNNEMENEWKKALIHQSLSE